MQPSLISRIFFFEEYTEIQFCLLKKRCIDIIDGKNYFVGYRIGYTFQFVSYAKLSYCFKRLVGFFYETFMVLFHLFWNSIVSGHYELLLCGKNRVIKND